MTDGKIKLKATKLPDQIAAICCIVCSRVSERPLMAAEGVRWPRLSEQFFRVDKWSVCRG